MHFSIGQHMVENGQGASLGNSENTFSPEAAGEKQYR